MAAWKCWRKRKKKASKKASECERSNEGDTARRARAHRFAPTQLRCAGAAIFYCRLSSQPANLMSVGRRQPNGALCGARQPHLHLQVGRQEADLQVEAEAEEAH